jgi:dienelactone hydrolase
MMIETCCQIGTHAELTGITTEPRHGARRIATLFVNAGLVPKFGPYRLYAEAARRLAASGWRSMRFDLGDIGDSVQIHSGVPLIERTRLDITAAIDHLHEVYDLDGVVLAGLCSGAEDSFRHAAVDHRVLGVVLIDPFSYRTTGWYWRNALQRVARRSMRALGLFTPLNVPGHDTSMEPAAMRRRLRYEPIRHEESSRILADLVDRGVRIHFIYTGGANETFNHPGQLRAMFPGIDFRGLVTVDHLPRLDHTQPLHEERVTLIDVIEARLALLGRPDTTGTAQPAGERLLQPAAQA